MFSESKKLHKELLLEYAEQIQFLVKIGTIKAIELAEGFGEMYVKLENKIQTNDYTQEDYHLHGIIGRQKDEEKLNENK